MEKIKNVMTGLLIAVFTISVMAVFVGKGIDGDTWWHLSSGKAIVENKGIPEKDTFSYAVESKWYSHEWLFDVFSYSTYKIFGAKSIVPLRFILILLMFALMCGILAKTSAGKWKWAGAIMFMPFLYLVAPFLVLRPQLITFIFILFFIFILEGGKEKNRNYFYLLPVAAVIWVNFHAFTIAGAGLVFLYAIEKLFSRDNELKGEGKFLLIIGIGVVVGSLFSPMGIKSLYFFSDPAEVKNYIKEWQSMLEMGWDSYTVIFTAYSVLLLLSLIKGSRENKGVYYRDLILSAILLSCSIYARKMIPVYMVVTLPMIIKNSGSLVEEKFLDHWLKKIILIIICIIVALLFAFEKVMIKSGNIYPVKAMEFIRNEKVAANVYQPYFWAGYFEFEQYPDYKTMVNGRLNVPFEVSREYSNIYFAEGDVYALLDKYNIQTVLLPYSSPLVKFLIGDYKTIYFDDISVMMTRANTDDMILNKFQLFNEPKYTEEMISEIKNFTQKYTSERSLLTLALVYQTTGRERAIQFLEELDSAGLMTDVLYNYYGMLYYDIGDKKNSSRIWKKSHNRPPEIEKRYNRVRDAL